MKKVLIIDDDQAILEAMQLAIEDEGYEVLTVSDGNKAVDNALQFLPDIVLVDLLLSGKDGTEIIELLRKNEKTNLTPVVLLSAHPSAAQIAKKSGATGFLAKPFDVDELLKLVSEYTQN